MSDAILMTSNGDGALRNTTQSQQTFSENERCIIVLRLLPFDDFLSQIRKPQFCKERKSVETEKTTHHVKAYDHQSKGALRLATQRR
jgi:hypothetical protein